MHTLTRRQWLQTTAAGAAALALPPRIARAADTGFTLPPLPYPFNALEPAIDAKTMEIHHDKHHAAYVKNLNDALAKHPELLKRPVGELLRDLKSLPVDEKTRTAVRNNGGGHYNHSLFWQIMGPHAGGEPTGPLGDAIKRDFRSFDAFKTEFKDYAMKRFGSGWAWLVAADGKLVITSTPNQDSTLTEGRRPLLGIDVWEHAYYLKYQNRRNDYVDAWWSVVNWKTAGEHFARRA